MSGLDFKEMNSFLRTIRDTSKPIEERNSALEKLAGKVGQQASAQQGRFDASLATFEQQWSQFEQTQFAFESSLDSILGLGAGDDDEADQIVKRIQTQMGLEKRYPSTSPESKTVSGREQTLTDLQAFIRRSRPNSEPEGMDDEDELARLERELEAAPFNPRDIAGDVDEITRQAEESIGDLEAALEGENDDLEALEDEDEDLEGLLGEEFTPGEETRPITALGPLNDSLSDRQVAPFSRAEDTPSMPSVRTEVPARESPPPATQKQDKPGFWSRFAKHFMSFITGVGKLLGQLGGNKISLADATTKLKETQRDLSLSGKRLERANTRFQTAIGEIQSKRTELGNASQKHQQVYKTLKTKRAALSLLHKKTGLKPEDKAKAIKVLENSIAEIKSEHEALGGKVKSATHQLERACEKATKAHEKWTDAEQLHRVATKSVGAALEHVEKALKQEQKGQARLIGQQHQAKKLLQTSRSAYKEAQEQQQSTEEETPESDLPSNRR